MLGNLFAQPLAMSSLVYFLFWSPPPHIPYISSPNQCLLFATHENGVELTGKEWQIDSITDCRKNDRCIFFNRPCGVGLQSGQFERILKILDSESVDVLKMGSLKRESWRAMEDIVWV